jgi:predicted enzyme related to lactoylglutathione lyase
MASSGRDKHIDYIEFNVKDIARARSFYGSTFGWTFTDYGADYCEFSDGNLKGGFANAEQVKPRGGPLVILFADDLADTLKRVEKAGGGSKSRSSISPADAALISPIRRVTNWRSGPTSKRPLARPLFQLLSRTGCF